MDESIVRTAARGAGSTLATSLCGLLLLGPSWSQETPDAASGAAAASPPATQPGELTPTDGDAGRTLSPYLTIVQRNPFGLQDPPPPPPPEPEPEPEVKASDLKLSGITTLLGGKHAMFVLQESGKSEMVYSGLVKEGDTDPVITGLKVVSIDEKAGAVRVVYGGDELLLDFKNNGLDLPKASVAAAARPGQPNPAVQAGRPGGLPANVPPPPGTVPPNVRRVGNTSFSTGGANTAVPSRSNRTAGRSGGSVLSPRGGGVMQQQPVMTPAEQVIVMRTQEMAGEQAGIPMPPSLPIPGLDPGLDPGMGGELPPGFSDPGMDGGPPMPDFPPLPGQ